MIGGTAEARSIEYESSVVGTGLDQEHTHFDDFAKEKEFSELQSQLCPASVMCYAIKSSTWYIISVSQIGDVDWALDAFDHLVLEQDTKEMLAGLVQQHRHNKDRVLADVIESKGKGLVIVLHGAPGVGKTLTAETIAEYTKKPLYPINIGELTSEDDIVEKLQMHFNRASHWDAVLLLDEADVLLEKRSFEDLHRNGIVSVFLRMLEYYEGILFLTTNRLLTMDTAFQSRIHIAIRYPDLTPDARRQIWEKFIYRIDALEGEGKAELLDHLDDMEAWPLNGRQIRNVLSIAESLSLTMHRRRGALRFSQVEKVANETIRFQDFFEDTSKERKSQLGDFGSRQFQERKFRGPR
ncbi:P-loop containing nucleoside triphosphate hydrolase protein [Thozetella sp. PMI_491]|nr:P-loop containing nucleoside triphosphate hydrolase protein [Thozetella sp. PMI_491]